MPVKSYDELLLTSLQNPVEAAAYLTACYEDSEPVFWQGLRMVVQARGGVASLAQKTTLTPEQLSQFLSDEETLPLSVLTMLLEALGFSLSFSVADIQNVA